jgi:outer membrane protein assembly factor BamB
MQPIVRRWFALIGLLAVAVLARPARGDDWPQWLGPHRDGVWRETGLVDKFPEGGPPVKWRTKIGTGYAGPAVAGDRVYLMDRIRATDKAGKPLRATRDGHPGMERVLCLNARDGKIIWKHEYNCPYTISYANGPRVTPVVRDGRVYALGAMGDLMCLDAKTGKPVWSKNLPKAYDTDPPVWGWATHPLLDGDLLYTLVGGKDSAAVAFNKDTGKEVWKALNTEEIGYSPPMIYKAGGKRQLIIWLSDTINGLDPATGKVYWTVDYPGGKGPQRPAVNIATVRCAGDLLFLSSVYHGPMMLKLDANKPAASVLWRGKSNSPFKPDGAHVTMAPPILQGGYVYAIGGGGGLRCAEATTGKQEWKKTYEFTSGKQAFCNTAFLVPQGKRFVIFNDQGELLLAELTPKDHKLISKAKILKPDQSDQRGRMVVWSFPAFAHKCVFARNDEELVCVSLAAEGK